MQSLMLIVHVALAIGVIGLVLIQHGKGADAGAAFGSGASSTVFGARGSASFMTRLTTILAALFFVTSLVLFYLAAHRDRGASSVTDLLPSSVPTAVQESAEEGSGVTPVETESDMPASTQPETDLPAVTEDAPAATVETDTPPAVTTEETPEDTN